MDLQNYTNTNVFKKVYEHREVPNKDDMIAHPAKHSTLKSGNQMRNFNPYTNNMGTTVGK